MSAKINRADYIICLLLVVLTLAVYWQVHDFGLIMLDDGAYVSSNQHVLSGLTLDSVKWAFGANYQANWHPLTWLSLMVDQRIGGGDYGTFHVTNLVLHLLNTLLLFLLLRWMTGSSWKSAAVAALFALHPTHVESVAWVTERKDVLSTLFWFLTMLAYVHYARRPRIGRYALVISAFALGLMAKPMLVSLPFVLLLMDIWPLGRFAGKGRVWPLVLEKTPLFALAGMSCAVTFWAQKTGGAVVSSGIIPVGERLANALVAYVAYAVKTVCPLNLCVSYAHQGDTLPAWQVIGSAALLLAVTVTVVRARGTRPYLLVGWLWYLVTLVPVIGLVQVGQQAMADRYTYVTTIGLFVILAWGLPEVVGAIRRMMGAQSALAPVFPVIGVAVFVGLAAGAYYQVGYWRDSVTLFEHGVAVCPRSYLAHLDLGDAYTSEKRYAEAVLAYQAGLRLRPDDLRGRLNLGFALMKSGDYKGAEREFLYVRQARTDDVRLNNYLAGTLVRLGRIDEAIQIIRDTLRDNPGDIDSLMNLGCAYFERGNMPAAEREFRTVLRIDPDNEIARRNLAAAERALGN